MSQSVLDLANSAAEFDDQSVTTTGGFDFVPPVEGVTILRFVEYIEIGAQPQKPFQGKAKPDNLETFLGFELLHPKHIQEYTDAAGITQKVPHFVRVRIAVKTGDKARYKKLLNKMAYGRDIKHMAQMLGEGFIADIFHYKPDDKRVYANLDKDGEWSLRAPFSVDPLTEAKTAIPIPQPTKPLRIFLWKRPTPETWASLYIDGTRTVKTEGAPDKEVSKNWLQELIGKAKDYSGSALEAMLNNLGGLSVDTPAGESVSGTTPDTTTSSVSTTPQGTASPSELALGELAKTETPSTASVDDLAALGLG